MRPWTTVCLLFLLLSSLGCGPTVDLTKGLQIRDVSTGWFDAGIVNGKAKLTPSISFKLRNISDQRLTVLQVNALFRRVNEKYEWGSGFVQAAGCDNLAPAAPAPTPSTGLHVSDLCYYHARQHHLPHAKLINVKDEP